MLEHELTVAEWMGLGMMLAIPYLLIGGVWSATHTEHLHQLHGVDLAVSFLGSIASWPVLLFSDICIG